MEGGRRRQGWGWRRRWQASLASPSGRQRHGAQPATPGGLPLRRPGGRRQTDQAFGGLLDCFTEQLTEVGYRSFATANTYAKWARN